MGRFVRRAMTNGLDIPTLPMREKSGWLKTVWVFPIPTYHKILRLPRSLCLCGHSVADVISKIDVMEVGLFR